MLLIAGLSGGLSNAGIGNEAQAGRREGFSDMPLRALPAQFCCRPAVAAVAVAEVYIPAVVVAEVAVVIAVMKAPSPAQFQATPSERPGSPR